MSNEILNYSLTLNPVYKMTELTLYLVFRIYRASYSDDKILWNFSENARISKAVGLVSGQVHSF